MNDDLMKRLRGVMCGDDPVIEEAADYIKRLEKALVRTFEHMMEDGRRVETLEAALTHIWAWYPVSVSKPHETIDAIKDYAFAAIKGEKKDD